MVSELEKKVRELDDYSKKRSLLSIEISKKTGTNINIVRAFLRAKRLGFNSHSEYLEFLVEQRGFNSKAEYYGYLARQKGFNSPSEYKEHFARNKGFNSRGEYNDNLARKKGFKSHTKYQEHFARQKGFNSITEYREHFARQKGFNSITEYYECLANKKFQKDIEIIPDSRFENILTSRNLSSLEEEEREMYYSLLGFLVDNLPDRERKIIRERFYFGSTLEEVGKEIGVTTERVRQIQENALWRLGFMAKIARLDEFYVN
jgi:RNA polymerase sigma factor (sigma-70 family)